MNFAKPKRPYVRVLIATTLSILAVSLVLINSVVNAQTIIADPQTVQSAKPQVVSIKKKDGSALDPAVAAQVITVKVGEAAPVPVAKDAAGVTFTPPPDLTGIKSVQLLDKDGIPVKDSDGTALTMQLTYGGVAAATGSPTPDMGYVEKFNAEARRNNLVGQRWYHPVIIVIFFLLSGGFVLVIVRGILFSRSTFRSPGGLPVGSFRAILAYTLVLFLGFYVLVSLLCVSYFAPPEFLLGIVATVIGFYFGSRSGDEVGADTSRTGTVRGIVRKGANPVSGASVKFKSSDGTQPYSRISDVDGRFDLRGVKPGKYKVSAETTAGRPAAEQEISVAEGSDHEIVIVITDGGGPGGGGQGAGGQGAGGQGAGGQGAGGQGAGGQGAGGQGAGGQGAGGQGAGGQGAGGQGAGGQGAGGQGAGGQGAGGQGAGGGG